MKTAENPKCELCDASLIVSRAKYDNLNGEIVRFLCPKCKTKKTYLTINNQVVARCYKDEL